MFSKNSAVAAEIKEKTTELFSNALSLGLSKPKPKRLGLK